MANRRSTSGQDIDPSSVDTEETHTETIGANDRHYAGDYDGTDADARLTNALAAINPGDVIYLENATYSTDRTISTGVHLVGTAATRNSEVGTAIADTITWTSDSRVVFRNIRGAGDIQINGILSRVLNCNGLTITVNEDRVIVSRGTSLSVTFNSGTTDGIADTLTKSAVTDNGTNTIGDA